MRRPIVYVGGPFSAAMKVDSTGVDFDTDLRLHIEQVHGLVRQLGGTLLSAHLADSYGTNFSEDEIVPRDKAWAFHCDLYIALLPLGADGRPYRTDGTYVEIGLALGRGKRVVLVVDQLHHPDQSYFVRNLDKDGQTRIVDWNVFFANIGLVLADEISKLLGDSPLSHDSCLPREQITEPQEILARLAVQDSPEEVQVCGVDLVALPGVLSPRFSHSPDFMMEKWHIPKGCRVLDLGCGSGILGVFSLMQGAGFLTSVDLNPKAIENTVLNLRRHNLENHAEVVRSDLDSSLAPDQVFDVILLSPPYWNRPAGTPLEMSCYDENYRFLRSAVALLPSRLREGGHAFIVFSDQGDLSLLTNEIEAKGLRISRFALQRPTMAGGHVRVFYDLVVR